jgi:hypothetical protein
MTPELSMAIKFVENAGYRVLKPKRAGLPPEAIKAVLQARRNDDPFIRIARRLGLTKGQVAGVTTRYRLNDLGVVERRR